MTNQTIDVKIDGPLAVLKLNRPEAHNAISAQMKRELAQALHEIEGNDAIRALVITGAGNKAFCAGADIKERSATDPTSAEFVSTQRATVQLFSRIANLKIPTIAALNGIAVGGGAEIALACDFRIAAEGARFGLTEINLGVIPAGGGTQRLARLIGTARAKRLVMTGEILNSEKTLALGIVEEVVADSELMGRTREFAQVLTGKAPLALQIAKQVIDQGAAASLETGLELELQGAAILFASEDRKEGMRAFLEKRVANFVGR